MSSDTTPPAAPPAAPAHPSSVPPGMRGITWPMVAYALVRELPSSLMVVAGCVVAVTFILHATGSSLEPLAAVIVPAVVSALGRSRPDEGTIARLGVS